MKLLVLKEKVFFCHHAFRRWYCLLPASCDRMKCCYGTLGPPWGNCWRQTSRKFVNLCDTLVEVCTDIEVVLGEQLPLGQTSLGQLSVLVASVCELPPLFTPGCHTKVIFYTLSWCNKVWEALFYTMDLSICSMRGWRIRSRHSQGSLKWVLQTNGTLELTSCPPPESMHISHSGLLVDLALPVTESSLAPKDSHSIFGQL